jgi:hypothetical protein
MIGEPFVAAYPDRPYFGIRFSAPYRGMFSQVAEKTKVLDRWCRENQPEECGPRFLRYWVIEMRGRMELEVGVVADRGAPPSEEVSPGTLPAGRYATLVYRGLGLAANKALLGWIDQEGLQADRAGMPDGDHFGCRYEAYLTDPKREPRKKQWDIELAIRLQG